LATKVVLALEQNELNTAALGAHLGHKTVSGELKKQIQRLREAGLIAYTLPAKPNSRLQRYRLTDAGKAKLAQISAVPSASFGAISPTTIAPQAPSTERE
jgi:ATP-dependent DNA helicase RecG